ncbi:MAG: fibronectin type III domain-containing protein [Planctomycetaceae bacterium]|nr:fibronectin type III domain-containing protein [Planctomycetaceae bacterium]
MKNRNLLQFFANHSKTVSSKVKQKHKRSCRIEELENREMLSVSPGAFYALHDHLYQEEYADTLVVVEPSPTAAIAPASEITPFNDAIYNEYEKNLVDSQELQNYAIWREIDGELRLTEINAENRNLTGVLDLSNCTELTLVDVSQNQLTSLDLSGNVKLASLNANDNQLTSLNVSGCGFLDTIYANKNQLTELDVSQSAVLRFLDVRENRLESLDLRNNTFLSGLWANDNELTYLNVSASLSLTTLYFHNNQLKLSALELGRPVADYTHFGAGNQRIVPPALNINDTTATVDLSSEYEIDGVRTTFIWGIRLTNGNVVIDPSFYTNVNGVFTFTEIPHGARIYCLMTNSQIPGLNLTTSNIVINRLDPPSDIVGASKNATTLTIGWKAINATRYIVEYRYPNETEWRQIPVNATNTNTPRAEIPVVTAGSGEIHIRITAIGTDDSIRVISAERVIGYTGAVPENPNRSIKAKSVNRDNGTNWVNLTWLQVGSNFEYEIRNVTTGEAVTVFVGVTEYRWDGLDSNKRYRFEIVVKNAAGIEARVVKITAKTANMPRGTAPTALRAIAGETSVAINWRPPVNTQGLMGYEIRVIGTTRNTEFVSRTITVDTGTTNYLVDGLPDRERFRFEVYAVTLNEHGWVFSSLARVNAATTKPFPAVKSLRPTVSKPIQGQDVFLNWNTMLIPGATYEVGFWQGKEWQALPSSVAYTVEIGPTRSVAIVSGLGAGRITLAVRAVIPGEGATADHIETGRVARTTVNVRASG